MKDNLFFLNHILNAITNIENFIKNVKNFDEFNSNNMVFSAVAHEMEVIGEASNNITNDFRLKNPNIPWKKMVSMRNILIHEYFGVDRKVVWDTIREDLPVLKKLILHLL